MRLRFISVLLPALVLYPQVVRAEFKLKSEDRVVFFGDTLVYFQTRGFTEYVESFVRSRYPQVHARFFNCGLLRETAADGLRRLEADLNPLSPTVVVVVFGLYDPDRQAFEEGKLTEFRKNYVGILDGIKKLNARMVLVTPPRPRSDQLRNVPSVDYAEVVGRYAQAIREIGANQQVPVVDWFQSSSELHETSAPDRPARYRRERLLPTGLAHAVLAAQLLKLWQAEPIELTIEVDWNSDTASVSSGQIKINKRTEKELTVELNGVPLPWGLRRVKPQQLQAGQWPGAELCQYILKMNNVPEAGVQLMLGRRSVSIDRDKLQNGINVTGWQPIQSHKALRDLLQAMARKHKFRFDLWQRMPQRRPKEPELQEAFELHLKTLQLYEEGTARIIFRLPKTFDILLSFKVREQSDAPTTPQEKQTQD